jgi:hypothetical protein
LGEIDIEIDAGAPAGERHPTPSGFQGAVGSLPLVDLLQVWSLNGFSGLVIVTAVGVPGRIYFADGAIVHAEAGDVAGEAAISTIIGWPQGSFELFPNTATLARTIEKSVSHLLLDAHRVLDERRRAGPAQGPPPGARSAAPPPPSRPAAPPAGSHAAPGKNVLDQIRAIPGVRRAVRFGADGRPQHDPSPESEALAAQALYLALNPAAAVAQAFGLHALSIASLRSARESLVVVHSAGQYLCVAVSPDAALDQVVAQLRALLARPSREGR